ncbi:GNAT family N-acetyltransferase [Aeromicrobium sp. CTD01-1L150]|uniref:GNAT family N-acetyltransferase n=1 Tax=Aeromicrobium sp. CTD01-1L150 TaxID=3341830 RepID=UPI0035C1F565
MVRPLRRSDAGQWQRLRQEDAGWLAPWEATLPPGAGFPSTSYSTMIRTMRRRARQGTALPFVIDEGGRMIGQVTVNGITGGSAQWASIGYWIASSHAGRGITPVAVALVGDHLLDVVGLHRIEISVRPENVSSLRIVAKLGLQEVGLARGYLHIAGQWRDHRIFQELADTPPGRLLDRLTATS